MNRTRQVRKGYPGLLGEAGVTLPELMVVLGIIIVATTLALPNYVAWNAKTKLKQATTELHSNLNLARMLAMNRNTTVTVTLGLVGGKVTATATDPGSTSANCLGDSKRCLMPIQVMPTEVTAVSADIGGVPQTPILVRFTSLGLLTGVGTNNQTLTFTNSYGLTYQVQVTPGGKARWCPGTCS
jgi:Tfp pilus assembly protein FimT